MTPYRGREWVALPWWRSPRWFLPKHPSGHAKAGLSVYLPVTIRSRIGWEAARALADRGAFRLLRGSGLIPREVWEAAGPLVPEGGGLAVARGNHPGRFGTLVFDEFGTAVAFVKIARDTPGSEALSKEREAIEMSGSMLPLPLFPPTLLDHSDGVLVFEAIDTQPRAAPWRLPEDVAFALGVFFHRTSTDGGTSGTAHGDFAPWNLIPTDGHWGLVDWESSHVGAPPYFDLFHYLIQSNSELRRPLRQTILAGLRGKGWVGAAIAAYAAGAQVDVHDGSHFFGEYLRISLARSDRGSPKRAVRIRSDMLGRIDT
jgi:phosphotransferase family enzyme